MIIKNNTSVTLMNAVLISGPHVPQGHIEVSTSAWRSVLPFEGTHPLGGPSGLRIQAGLAGLHMDFPDDPFASIYTLLTFKPGEGVMHLRCIPDEACPVHGVVDRFRSLVGGLTNPELRRFLDGVFGIPEVFLYYFTCPASLAHHHKRAGGLALHSVGSAEAVRRAVLDQTQQELGVVRQLIHDVGKVYSYETGRLTAEARQLGHDAVGLRRLFPLVESLIQDWPEGGWAMLAMLLRSASNPDFPRCPAVYRMACASDFYDAERDLASQGDPRTKGSWPGEPSADGDDDEDGSL